KTNASPETKNKTNGNQNQTHKEPDRKKPQPKK
ncbi:unnamed protein product, partial [marine sediment metagenome]